MATRICDKCGKSLSGQMRKGSTLRWCPYCGGWRKPAIQKYGFTRQQQIMRLRDKVDKSKRDKILEGEQ
jgi:hypothetical protein